METSDFGVLDLSRMAKYFSDETAARVLLEKMRWANGAICPLCKKTEHVYRMRKMPDSKKPGRPGLLRCRKCKKQFTVTTGTVFEDSHIPLSKWLLAIHLLCASKKGMSAHQLMRMLGLKSYRSAWFMAHRLRYAMMEGPMADMLTGIIEADETYVGAKKKRGTPGGRPGPDSHKSPVVALVQRGGKMRAMPMPRVTAENLAKVINEHVDKSQSTLMTDEAPMYTLIGRKFAGGHGVVDHHRKEYVRDDAHTNTAEGFFSLLKRGINGVYHHVGRGHLGRYCDEFSFRYNLRKVSDGERSAELVLGAEGKRLTYKQPAGTGEATA
jgi:transposase-like protein